ncbi:DUF1444 family protein [Brevibacillus nitrificans]|uniref:DUF1444 family protein n=1 Tax=Brevibacillus nitrificans TaxID=651560 RepID=UPI00285F92BF|nr:DUF1444 family protein [Brevibacillus nitrificans]MDR7318699.1 uncharacterized protein YtpQ (UPF0354 family) [Brevibacillus nitrificans]
MSENKKQAAPRPSEHSLNGQERNVYPVLRHSSMIAKYPDRWVTKGHTADTAVLYALDIGEGYLLIEREMLTQAGWSEEQLHQAAMRNLQGLPYSVKTQEVAGNRIHFISPTDGYAASRVLLEPLLQSFDQQKQGDQLGVAIPHQDVLIVADLSGDTGAHLLARLTYDFASKGQVPISVLPFFWEEGELTPFLVVSQGADPEIQRKKK